MSRFTSPDFLRQAGDKHVRAQPPPSVNLSRADINRLHSFHLKGKDHFAIDRELATQADKIAPGFADLVLGERAFLQRAVRHMAVDLGITQFLQVGAGLPAPGDPHQIAQEGRTKTRVVYATSDPVVLTHHLALTRDGHTTTAVHAGLQEPNRLLNDPESRRLLDLNRPIGLLLTGVVPHVFDTTAAADAIATLRANLAPGSHMVLSHYCRPDPGRYGKDAQRAERLEQLFMDRLGHGRWRSHEEIATFFDGWESVPPGLLQTQKWRTMPVAPPLPGSYQMPHRNRRLIIGGMGRI